MTIFSTLTAKIAAGIGIALLLIIALMSFLLHRAHNQIEQLRGNLAECNAARAEQNAAIIRLHDQGVEQKQAFDQAVQQGHDAIAQAQPRIRVVRQTAVNGCPTPPQIMGAGL